MNRHEAGEWINAIAYGTKREDDLEMWYEHLVGATQALWAYDGEENILAYREAALGYLNSKWGNIPFSS